MPSPAATAHATMDRRPSTHRRGKNTHLDALQSPHAPRKSRFKVARRILPHTSDSR